MSGVSPKTAIYNCFKAYDVRGEIGKDLDSNLAYKIGRSFVQVLKAKKVIIGRDNRESSPEISNALVTALLDEGTHVLDLGLCGTEEMYFATSYYKADGGIQVTASHNPASFNGMKFVGKGSKPLDNVTEFKEIQVLTRNFTANFKSTLGSHKKIGETSRQAYIKKILSLVNISKFKKLKVLVNFGNGAAGPTFTEIAKILKQQNVPIKFIRINEKPDGKFPNGAPNPLLAKNHQHTGQHVKDSGADLGIAFDGDFDRCFFFDENGEFINGEYVVGFLAEYFLEKGKSLGIVHDLRVIWNIQNSIKEMNGKSILCNTGHVFVKEAMRRHSAIYGGEISGHHYFKDFYFCDSGMLPWLLICEILSVKKRNIKSLVENQFVRFRSSGEQNFLVRNIENAIKKIENHFNDHGLVYDYTDGLSVTGKDWRFNLRPSNTENLLRLNIESRGGGNIVDLKLKEISSLLTSC